MTPVSELFKDFTDLIKKILSGPKNPKVNMDIFKDPLDDLNEKKVIVKAAFDNEIIDLEEYIEKSEVIEKEIEKIKKKEQSYADAIIRNSDGKILLLRRSLTDDFQPDTYCLPGGKIEKDEEPEDAVIREVKEETNIDVVSPVLVLKKKIDSGFIYYFNCTLKTEDELLKIILDNSEHINFTLANKEEYSNLNLILDLKNTLLGFDDVEVDNFDLFPRFGEDKSKYSNIIEEIANTHPEKKDIFMLQLFMNEELDEDEYVEYIEKSQKDDTHKNKLTKISGVENGGKKKVVKWVTKTELKKLAKHAKNASHKDLETTIKESAHPQLREHAHVEIQRREKEEANIEEKEGYEAHEYHGKDFKYNSEQDAHIDEEGNKANPAKLYQYYDMRHKEQDNKLKQLSTDLDGSIKVKQALGNKLKKAYYQKMNRTKFAGDEESCYKTALEKLEKMGMTEEDIEPEKVKKIIKTKLNKK